MKLTLAHPLYRRQTPSNELPPQGYIDCGGVIEITDVVLGKSIDSNSVWYKGDDGMYYWSGGITNTEFAVQGKDFLNLLPDDQFILVSEAMNIYYRYFQKMIPEFTGMSATFKRTGNQFLNFYAIVIQVNQKNQNAAYAIPPHVLYKGFAIPTDVIAVSITSASILGDSLSRINSGNRGSAGFVIEEKNSSTRYLVTNYHVACEDLMLRNPRMLMLEKIFTLKHSDAMMPAFGLSQAATVGKVDSGMMDWQNDVALIRLNEGSSLTNNIRGIGTIKEIRTLASIRKNFRPDTITLKMHGARSNRKREGAIVSLNSPQPIEYLNNTFTHTVNGLIQARKMSDKGDSGSAAVDLDNKLVGILVADDSDFSYIIPVETIILNFNLKPNL